MCALNETSATNEEVVGCDERGVGGVTNEEVDRTIGDGGSMDVFEFRLTHETVSMICRLV